MGLICCYAESIKGQLFSKAKLKNVGMLIILSNRNYFIFFLLVKTLNLQPHGCNNKRLPSVLGALVFQIEMIRVIKIICNL